MKSPRDLFWKYCIDAASSAKARARKRALPYEINAYAIDQLFVDQGYRCAVSRILLRFGAKRDPFGPSLDRIQPALGYVPGNIRVVCNIVNFAMNCWGEAVFRELISQVGGFEEMKAPNPHFWVMHKQMAEWIEIQKQYGWQSPEVEHHAERALMGSVDVCTQSPPITGHTKGRHEGC